MSVEYGSATRGDKPTGPGRFSCDVDATSRVNHYPNLVLFVQANCQEVVARIQRAQLSLGSLGQIVSQVMAISCHPIHPRRLQLSWRPSAILRRPPVNPRLGISGIHPDEMEPRLQGILAIQFRITDMEVLLSRKARLQIQETLLG